MFQHTAFLHGLLWSALGVAAVLAITFVVALRAGRHSVIDTAWGMLFVVLACVSFANSAGHGCATRRWLLFALPVLWGVRLAQHIGRRTVGAPEDPRYEALLAKAKGNRQLYALRSVYLLQGVLAFLIAAPILVGAYEGGSVGVLGYLGVAVWCVGVIFEGIGDLQLEHFKRDPANRGTVMDRGLWRYTRHPNYFGDACVWWGIFLVSSTSWPGVLTIPAPVLMTLLLTRGSGARILDRHMSTRPGWAEYAARTSGFFPLPPKRGS